MPSRKRKRLRQFFSLMSNAKAPEGALNRSHFSFARRPRQYLSLTHCELTEDDELGMPMLTRVQPFSAPLRGR